MLTGEIVTLFMLAFWTKIRTEFIKRGGTAERNWNSLSNRFNNTIQKEVNKYIGVLQQALRKYHSGWVMDDYVSEARRVFQMQSGGKPFIHEVFFSVLRRLPKFEVVASQFHHRVARALLISDSDKGGQDEDDVNNKENDGTTAGLFFNEQEALDSSLCSTTPRPSERLLSELSRPTTGKKKAKIAVFAAASAKKKRDHLLTGTVAPDESYVATVALLERNYSIQRIAWAAEAKLKISQEQVMLQFFTKPHISGSKLFFEHRRRQFLEIALAPAPPVTNPAQNRNNVGNNDDNDVFKTPTSLRCYPIPGGASTSNSTSSHTTISSGRNEHNLEEDKKGDEDNDEVEFDQFDEHHDRNNYEEEEEDEDNGGRRYHCCNNDVDAAMTMSRGFDIVGRRR